MNAIRRTTETTTTETTATTVPTTTETTETTTTETTTAADEIFAEIVGCAEPTSPQITTWAWRVAQLSSSELGALCDIIVAKSYKDGVDESRPASVVATLPTVAAVMTKASSVRKKLQMEEVERIAPFNPLGAISKIYYSYSSVRVVNKETMVFGKTIVSDSLDLTKVFPAAAPHVEKLLDMMVDNTRHILDGCTGVLPYPRAEVKKSLGKLFSALGVEAAMPYKVWQAVAAGVTTTNNPRTKQQAVLSFRSMEWLKRNLCRAICLSAQGKGYEYRFGDK